MKNSNQRLIRWSWKLQEWSPFIQYIKGRDNVVADFLSRNSIPDDTVIDQDAEYMYPPVSRCNLALTCNLDRDTIRKHQKSAQEEMQKDYSSPDCLVLQEITYKVKGTKTLPVIPSSLVQQIISQFHDTLTGGHLGVEKTFGKIASRAYFKNMRKLVEEYVRTCDICQRVKYDNKKPPGMMTSSAITSPWDTLYMDLMGPYTRSHAGGFTNLLVVIDSFTKWTEIFPIREATTTNLGKVLEQHLFSRMGMPKCIVSDNGTVFTSNLFKYLCHQWNVENRHTSAYHPQSNLTERANRNVKTLIKAFLDGSDHKHWAKNLPFLQLAINTSKQESTGFTPAFLMFNRELNLPFDVSVGLSDSEINMLTKNIPKSQRDLVYDRSQQYRKIIDLVCSNLQRAQA